jgi:hypothetical protein
MASTIFDWTVAGSGAPIRAGGAIILTEPGQTRSRFDERTPTTIQPSGNPAFFVNLEGRFHTENITQRTANNHSPTNGNTAAQLTFGPVTDKAHCIENLVWSYSGTPLSGSGNINIVDGGTTIFSHDITSGGPGFFPFSTPLKGSVNSTMVITLAAPGVSGVYAKVSANHWSEKK